jgi:hypothetical protein
MLARRQAPHAKQMDKRAPYGLSSSAAKSVSALARRRR